MQHYCVSGGFEKLMAAANAAAQAHILSRLWTGICGTSVTGRGCVTFNSTAYRDNGAGAHKAIYEAKKDDK
jgi:hypothetical protein